MGSTREQLSWLKIQAPMEWELIPEYWVNICPCVCLFVCPCVPLGMMLGVFIIIIFWYVLPSKYVQFLKSTYPILFSIVFLSIDSYTTYVSQAAVFEVWCQKRIVWFFMYWFRQYISRCISNSCFPKSDVRKDFFGEGQRYNLLLNWLLIDLRIYL